jgi:hypothetical protein
MRLNYSANINAILEFFPCTPQLTHRRGYNFEDSLSKLSKGLWRLRLVDLVFHMPH